jgi:hypothetical protein
MIKKAIKVLGLALMLGALPSISASANDFLPLNAETKVVEQSLGLVTALMGIDKISIKQKQPYDKAKDPAHRANTEISEAPRPQHGYFAVPLIVIGLAGILLYFSRFE